MRCPNPFKMNEELFLFWAARSLLLNVIPSKDLAFATPRAVQLHCVLGSWAEEVGLERHATDPRRGIDPARLKASRSDLQAPVLEDEVHTHRLRLDLEIRQQRSIREASEAIPGTAGGSPGGGPFDAEDHLIAFEADLQLFGLIRLEHSARLESFDRLKKIFPVKLDPRRTRVTHSQPFQLDVLSGPA